MDLVISIIFPVFGIVILGYGAVKLGAFPEAGIGGLSKFVFTFAIPVLLFEKLSSLSFPDTVSWSLLISFYGMICLQWAIAMAIGKYVFARPAAANAILGMGAAFGNLVTLGLPLGFQAYGEAGVLPLMMIVGLHSTFQFVLTSLLLERAQSGARGVELMIRSLKGSLGNPIVIGLICGAVVNIAAIPVPEMLSSMMAMIGEAAIPAAVFTMGAALAKYNVRGHLGVTAVMTVLKLFWLPFAVYWACTLTGVPAEWRAVACLLAGMPTGINVFLFAETYQSGQASAAGGIVISSFLSVFTLSAILVLTAP